jgi:hypothetical protein
MFSSIMSIMNNIMSIMNSSIMSIMFIMNSSIMSIMNNSIRECIRYLPQLDVEPEANGSCPN